MLSLALAGWWLWMLQGYEAPSAVSHPFPGTTLTTEQRHEPREHSIYVVEITQSAAAFDLIFAEALPDGRFAASTTTEFLDRNRAHIGINANFFYPIKATTPLFYYPRSGDPVVAVGITASNGKQHSEPWLGAGLYEVADGRLHIGDKPASFRAAVAGHFRLVIDGTINSALPLQEDNAQASPYARSLIGTRDAGATLILAVVDGKRAPQSQGLTYRESAALMLEFGAEQAVEMDGGGSSTLAMRHEDTTAYVVNVPMHTRIPFRQRPVANHLAIRWR